MMDRVANWLLDCFGSDIRAMHELKCHPQEFAAMANGAKGHEVRRFDQDFQTGDWLLLREWDPETGCYSGQQMFREITYITPPGSFGLPADVNVMSVK